MPSTMPPNLKLATLALAINAALFSSFAAQAADEDLPSVTLPAITVVAETETADGPVQGIAASRVSSTTGRDESILKSTQSITVVGQEEIEKIKANNVMEALGYSTGINVSDTDDRTTEAYIIRGFAHAGSYRNGQKYQVNLFNGQQEIFGLDRIEVIKGPASVLSGMLTPGGVINAISKKPSFNNAYEVNAEVGSFDRKQVSTDLNHKVNDEIAVRLVGLYRNSDTFVEFVPDDRTYIAPSLKWRPSEDTLVTMEASYQHDITAGGAYLPKEGTLYPTKNGKIELGTNIAIKGYDKYDNKRYTLGYDIEHQITPALSIKHSLQYMDADIYWPKTYFGELIDGSDSLYTRDADKNVDESSQLTASVVGTYHWDARDNIENISLFGIDYAKQDHATARYGTTASPVDVFNIDRSKDTYGELKPYYFSWINDNRQIGAFLQNQTTFNDKWVGVLGIRHEKTALKESPFFDSEESDPVRQGDYSATTGRAGLVYLMDNGLAPYASYSQSYEAQLGEDRKGNLFEPTRGEQYEVGVRYQPEGSDTLLTGSLYRIIEANRLVEDPNGNAADEYYQVQLGEFRSQGLELEAKTQLGDNANLIAAYAYTDARITKASPVYPEEEGVRADSVPYNSFSLWGDYRFANFGIPQLTVGAGVRYKGDSVDGNDLIPNYTLVDAIASYDFSHNVKLSLNVKNLLDKEYLFCSYDCTYGEPRNIVGKVTYKW